MAAPSFRLSMAFFGLILLSVALTVAMLSNTAVSASSWPLTGLALVNTDDSVDVVWLSDNGTVTVNSGTNYSVRADIVGGQSVGSVSFQLTGPRNHGPKTENIAPYTMYGDYLEDGTRKLHGRTLPAGSYSIVVDAYSGSGKSGEKTGSISLSFTVAHSTATPTPTNTPTPSDATPDKPSNLTMSSSYSFNWEKGYSAAQLDWEVWESDDPVDPTGYRIEYRVDGDWMLYGDTSNLTDPYEVAKLSPATDYSFRVRSLNGSAVSASSNTVGKRTPSLPAPGKPSIEHISSTAVGIAWTVPAYEWTLSDGTHPEPSISHYVVTVYNMIGTEVVRENVVSFYPNLTVSNLAPSTGYRFAVHGVSSYSAVWPEDGAFRTTRSMMSAGAFTSAAD